MSKDCKDRTPPYYLVVNEDGIMEEGVGCFGVEIGGFHPKCGDWICPKLRPAPKFQSSVTSTKNTDSATK